MAKSSLTVTRHKDAKKIEQAIKKFARLDVLVGVPADKTERENDDESNGLNNAQIAYIQNFGAPEAGIPQREFMAPGIKAARPKIIAYFKAAAKYAMSGDEDGAMRALNAAGLTAQASIRKEIQDGGFIPLSPYTIAQRQRRGRSGTKPLIDTAQLRNSINYIIRDKKDAST